MLKYPLVLSAISIFLKSLRGISLYYLKLVLALGPSFKLKFWFQGKLLIKSQDFWFIQTNSYITCPVAIFACATSK